MKVNLDQMPDHDLEVFGPHLWPNHNALNVVTRFFACRPDLAYLQAARAAVREGVSTVKITVSIDTKLAEARAKRRQGSMIHTVRHTKNAEKDVAEAMENLYRLLERVMPRSASPKIRCGVEFEVDAHREVLKWNVTARWL